MNVETFMLLKSELTEIQSTSLICNGQKLMIFLYAMCNNSNREIQERWQHSGQTISKVIHEVAEAILMIQAKYIKQERPLVSSRILNDSKYSSYFGDCIGAIDGTHIPATVPTLHAAPFRNRKGFLSQNVLAACNFDMTFSYVLAGWEGSAHDGRVLEDAFTKGFPTREGKYYLGDAGYALSKNILTPYRGTRYHLKEWGQSNVLPRNKKELFNLRHSSLRNVIERVFGVIKKRFPTLNCMPSYKFPFQVTLVTCIIILHTFIRKRQISVDDFDEENIDELSNDYDSVLENLEENNSISEGGPVLNAWRDDIASRMWNDYVAQRR